jgi:foldase protein PrsA
MSEGEALTRGGPFWLACRGVRRAALALVLVALAAALLAAAGCGGEESGPLATIGGEEVTEKDLDRNLEAARHAYKEQGRKFPKEGTRAYVELRNERLAALAFERFFVQRAKAIGVDVTDEEVDRERDRLIQARFDGDENEYKKQLKKADETDEGIRATIRGRLFERELRDVLLKRAPVPERRIRRYYDEHKGLYYHPTRRDIRQILVKDRAKADDLYRQLRNGADFKELAERHSVDPGSRSLGGNISLVRGKGPAALERVAFSLPERKISRPIQTTFGWHIVQPLGPVEQERTDSYAQVKPRIRSVLAQNQVEAEFKRWLAGLRRQFRRQVEYEPGYAPTKERRQQS